MSIRRRVLRALRTFHDSFVVMGDEMAAASGHLVQIRKRLHDHGNNLQNILIRLDELAQMQVTKAEMIDLGRYVKELVEQNRALQKHILADSNDLGERVVVLEKRVGVR